MNSKMDIERFRKKNVMFIKEGETLEQAISREKEYVERCTGRKVEVHVVVQEDEHWAYVIWELEQEQDT